MVELRPRYATPPLGRDATSATEVVFAADSRESRDQWSRALALAAAASATRESFADSGRRATRGLSGI